MHIINCITCLNQRSRGCCVRQSPASKTPPPVPSAKGLSFRVSESASRGQGMPEVFGKQDWRNCEEGGNIGNRQTFRRRVGSAELQQQFSPCCSLVWLWRLKPTYTSEVIPGSAQPMSFGTSQRRMSFSTQHEVNGFRWISSNFGDLTGKIR